MNMLQRVIIILMLCLLALPMFGGAAEQGGAKPLLIDVRTEAEWQTEHLQGAILIPYEKIAAEIGKVAPDKKTKINLYCRTGRRSGIALDSLKKLGYVDVTNEGGVKEASEKLNIPIVKDAK